MKEGVLPIFKRIFAIALYELKEYMSINSKKIFYLDELL